MRLVLGAPVVCSDGVLGELADVVVEPNARRVTHLVVQPRHDHLRARLAPIELVAGTDGERSTVTLGCSLAAVGRLPLVEELAFVHLGEAPPGDAESGVGVEEVLVFPSYDDELAGLDPDPRVAYAYDRIPKGEAELRGASTVVSADGRRLGRVRGFLLDPAERLTHVLLEHGRLWRRRDLVVPIDAVASVETDAVTLRLSAEAIRALPAAETPPA